MKQGSAAAHSELRRDTKRIKTMEMKNFQKLTFMVIALLSHTAFAATSVQKMSPQQSLIQAINHEDFSAVQTAIKNGASVNAFDTFGTTPLMTANLITYKTMPPLVPYLVKEGASLIAKDHNGCTPLDYALLGFTPAIVAFLKNKKAPIGTNALVNAINQNNIPALEKALKSGANPNLIVGQGSLLCLLTCSNTESSLLLAEALLKAGAHVDLPDTFGNTPLMDSIQENNLKMIQLLIRHKADLNLQNKNGETALMQAVDAKNLPIVQALITAGAKTTPQIDKANSLGTALTIAVQSPAPSLDIIKALLKASDREQSINTQDADGSTALMYAVFAGNLSVVQVLLAAGAKTTPQADQAASSDTALLVAINQQTPSLPIIKALLNAPDSKDSINIQDNTGYTALMYAVGGSNLHLTQLLVAAGAKTTPQANLANNGLATALIIAVTQQTPSLAIVTALLGAHDIKDSINLQDNTGWTPLMYAVSAGNLPLIQALLTAGAKTTPQANPANYLNTALLLATDQNAPSLPVVDALLKASDIKDSINMADNTGRTALIYAVNINDLPLTQALIAAGAKTTPRANQANLLNTVLLMATSQQTPSLAIVKALLQAPDIKDSINLQSSDGWTPLMWAAYEGNLPIIQALLAAGAKTTPQATANSFRSDTALIIATGSETLSLSAIEALLKVSDIKDSINLQGYNGWTALMWAANRGNLPITKALLAAGANPTITTPQGKTAWSFATPNCQPLLPTPPSVTANNNLLNAVFNNDLPGVKKALAAGANPSRVLPPIAGTTTNSVLILAIGLNFTAIAQTLIAAKANVHFQNSQGQTALTEAASRGNLELIQELIAAKANVNIQESSGATALIYAAFDGNLALVNTLLAAGANPNFQTNAANTSATALILAAKAGSEAMVKALLGAPAISQSINMQDNTGSTALIYAASLGNTAMVQALASIKGIDANKQDNTGMTALMYAASNNNETINRDLLPLLKLLVKIPGINLNLINNHMNESVQCGPDGCAALDYALSEDYYNFLTNSGANPTF